MSKNTDQAPIFPEPVQDKESKPFPAVQGTPQPRMTFAQPAKASDPTDDNESTVGAEPKGETYWHGQWGGKMKEWHSERVRYEVEGLRLSWPRLVPTIVPKRFISAANDAQQDKFVQVAGRPRQNLAPEPRDIFTIDYSKGKNGQATEAEYREMRRKGTKRYLEAMAEYQAKQS